MFKIPKFLLKQDLFKMALIFTPVLVASLATTMKVSVYCYDMMTDIQVIKDLENNIENFKMPKLSGVKDIDVKITDFIVKKLNKSVVPAMKEPCEFFDLIEKVSYEAVPFYSSVMINIAKVRWNPNKKSEFHISDVFKVIKNLIEAFYKVEDLLLGRKIRTIKPSEYSQMFKNMIIELERIKVQLEGANSSFVGFMSTLLGYDVTPYIPLIKDSIEILSLCTDPVRHNS